MNFGKIRMNLRLNSVNFRNVKRKNRFEPHRNGRISPKFELFRSNPRTLAPTPAGLRCCGTPEVDPAPAEVDLLAGPHRSCPPPYPVA
jgi:hypothetical protein